MPWNPETYDRFRAERAAPFDDLESLIRVRPGMTAIDLGCGTGALTARLAARLPDSDVLGIDASAEMLAAAPAATKGMRFEQRRIEDQRGAYDLVLSNAALQWIDGHEALVPQVFGLVAPGGQLVIQVPSNHKHATHAMLASLGAKAPFRDALEGWTRVSPVLSIERYAEMLFAADGTEIVAFEKVFPHVLDDADAIVDWVSGTAMIPYVERLPEALGAEFIKRYRVAVREAFPQAPVFYPFQRTFLGATRTR